MSLATFLGYFAGFLTTISLIPQVTKTWKTKSTNDFSLGMLLIWLIGIACWVLYGALTNAAPIIIWNICTFFLAGTILTMKLKFKNINQKTNPKLNEKPPAKVFQNWGA